MLGEPICHGWGAEHNRVGRARKDTSAADEDTDDADSGKRLSDRGTAPFPPGGDNDFSSKEVEVEIEVERLESPTSIPPSNTPVSSNGRHLCGGFVSNIPSPMNLRHPLGLHGEGKGQRRRLLCRVVLYQESFVLHAASVPGETHEGCARFVEVEGASAFEVLGTIQETIEGGFKARGHKGDDFDFDFDFVVLVMRLGGPSSRLASRVTSSEYLTNLSTAKRNTGA